jgi:hypothetical protein
MSLPSESSSRGQYVTYHKIRLNKFFCHKNIVSFDFIQIKIEYFCPPKNSCFIFGPLLNIILICFRHLLNIKTLELLDGHNMCDVSILNIWGHHFNNITMKIIYLSGTKNKTKIFRRMKNIMFLFVGIRSWIWT